ncbi:MAG: FIST C-terminal domain-containing protein [Betaproteobacteria bacterium]|nr:FIST C-terminal domain-containing protein [Betaproteobacteria bacterium]
MPATTYLSELSCSNLHAVLADWQAAGVCQCLVFLPEAEAPAISRFQTVCRDLGLILAGAVFPELLQPGGPTRQGAVLLPLMDCPAPLLLENVSRADGVEAVARRLVNHLEAHVAEDQDVTLFCIFDALVPNIATHLDAWYLALADRVHYLGVNAGSETFASIPCLFDNQRCIADGLLVQFLPGHPGGCLEHRYSVPERVITATSSLGNRIVQIDWRPALEVYSELMREQYGVSIDRENFYSYAVHFPFGILRADGEVLVRIPVALDEAGGIVCVGEIPPNSVLALLDARATSDQATASLAQDLQQLTHSPIPDLLLFYCAGRRMHMGPERMACELAGLQRSLSTSRIFGAFSLGEIGSSQSGGYPLFHNATLVGMPWLLR